MWFFRDYLTFRMACWIQMTETEQTDDNLPNYSRGAQRPQATPGPLFCCSMLNKQLLLKSELNIKRIRWLGWGGICVTLCTTIITYSSGFPHHSPHWVWGCVKRIHKPTNQVAVLYTDEVSYWLEAQRAVVVYKLTWNESAAFSIWTTS